MRTRPDALIVGVGVALLVAGVYAQQRGGTPQTDKVQPVNSGANPYRVVRDWAMQRDCSITAIEVHSTS